MRVKLYFLPRLLSISNYVVNCRYRRIEIPIFIIIITMIIIKQEYRLLIRFLCSRDLNDYNMLKSCLASAKVATTLSHIPIY